MFSINFSFLHLSIMESVMSNRLEHINSYLYSKLKIKTNTIHKKTHELSNLPLKIPNHFFTFLTSLLSGLKQNFTISPLFVDYLHSFAIFNYPALIFLKCVMIAANNSIIRLHWLHRRINKFPANNKKIKLHLILLLISLTKSLYQ